jgi:urea transport system ATP-binding protein
MAAAALTLDGLGVDFSGFKAVSNVSTVIEEGELRVLLGANGAGKTTLMDLVSGRTHATEGHVFLFDKEITNKEEFVIARSGLGRKFQIPSVFKELSVRRNLAVASCPSRGVLSNLRFGFPKASRDRVEEVLQLIGLADEAEETAANLSHGQTQWLELGLLIVQNPKVLLLDEPTAGMSRAETDHVVALIRRVSENRTLLMIEHDMGIVFDLADRISVLVYGQIIASDTPEKVKANPEVQRAYLGTEIA